MTDIDLSAMKARLLDLREETRQALSSAEADSHPVELDQSRVGRLSRMDALQVQAMAQEAERRHAVELTRIDAALERIESGDYGFCVNCGEEIAPKRLDFDPAAPNCIDCARGGEGD